MEKQSKNTAETGQNIPEMQPTTTSSSTITIIGAVLILAMGLGTLLFIMVNPNKDKDAAEKAQQEQTVIENKMPALVVIDKEPVSAPSVELVAQPEPIKKPALIRKEVKPTAVKNQGKNQKEIVQWYDRKKDAGSMKSETAKASTRNDAPANQTDGFNIGGGAGGQSGETDLNKQLISSVTPMAVASVLPDRNYVIAQGTSLDCALETALDSTLSGLTTCILSRDVYSDNGRVLLLDRGSKLTGEYTGGLRNGQRRLFVLWNRAKTPNGVVIALHSPSADALGRSGMSGWVDNHFLERFGTAIFLSVLSDGAKIYSAKQSSEGGVILSGGADTGSDLAGQILEKQADIPPTLIKNQGETIKVMVARDLDFSTVYSLSVD